MANNINLSDVQLYNQIADWNHVKKFDYNNNKLSDDLRLNENHVDESLAEDLLGFLKANFKKSDNFDDVVLFLRKHYNLSDIVYGIPKLFNKEFPGDLLEIRVLSKINEENKLIILVHTGIDGFNACEKIEKIEDTLYEDFNNNFSNVLFSAEFV